MVGLVVVSHSRALAEALIELVRQVAGKGVPIACAAGVGPQRKEFGTDATEIVEAIESVFSPEGVVVLMDLGSAILSAETALELLPDEKRPSIRLCAAPIVEGAIAAGLQISLGNDLETVHREAGQALSPKTLQISGPDESHPSDQEVPEKADAESYPWQEITLTINTPYGLHARPAALFVKTAAGYEAEVRVCKSTSRQNMASARSLNSLATLGVLRGDQIIVSARGPGATRVLDALERLVQEQFSAFAEQLSGAPATSAPVAGTENGISAIPLSEGIAMGPAFYYPVALPTVPDHRAEDPSKEWEIFQECLEETRLAIERRRQQVSADLGEAQAAIFDAHVLILEDPILLGRTRERILTDRHNAVAAWHQSIREVAETYRSLPDGYLRQRAADVSDVGNQVLFALLGKGALEGPKFSKSVILVARELTPTQTARLDTDRILALVTLVGGPTSHSAILARALGIPAVAGIDPSVMNIPAETLLALDGFSGTLWIDPPANIREKLSRQRSLWLERRKELRDEGHRPAATRDGHRLMIAANLGGIQDAKRALASGAEGVGLLRTEFLYLTRTTPAPEIEQVEALRQIGKIMGKRPICVRTLDIGGDKAIPYLKLPPEHNPFLGLRAIRLSLRHPDLFHTQLRAILRAGAEYDLRVMFPMISGMEEVTQAIRAIERAHEALKAENTPHCWPVKTGIMIETPAAALLSASLAEHLDFFSIGTNDLTQYTLAAERGNPHLTAYADGLHPAVLRLIHQAVDAAHRRDKPVGVCGELASDPAAVPVLVGMAVDELSMNPDAVPRIKSIISNLDFSAASALANEAMHMDSATAARRLAEDFRI